MGNLGVGEPLDESMQVAPIPSSATIFDKNSWEDISADEAHVQALLSDGSWHTMRMRVVRHMGSGVCEARALSRPGQFSGEVVRLDLFIDGQRCGLFQIEPFTVPAGHGSQFSFHVQASNIASIGV